MPRENDAEQSSPPLCDAVRRGRGNAAFLADLQDLYRQADRDLKTCARGEPRCLGGGVCCRFDLMDHRLMVATGELALLTQAAPPGPASPRRCPYQVGPRCTARSRRPLGCRTFFCGTSSLARGQELHERYHRTLRDLHERHGVPYLYVELTQALAECLPPELVVFLR
jgi:Fe-S-cluster containining protein